MAVFYRKKSAHGDKRDVRKKLFARTSTLPPPFGPLQGAQGAPIEVSAGAPPPERRLHSAGTVAHFHRRGGSVKIGTVALGDRNNHYTSGEVKNPQGRTPRR